jgi:hypothetical protein
MERGEGWYTYVLQRGFTADFTDGTSTTLDEGFSLNVYFNAAGLPLDFRIQGDPREPTEKSIGQFDLAERDPPPNKCKVCIVADVRGSTICPGCIAVREQY